MKPSRGAAARAFAPAAAAAGRFVDDEIERVRLVERARLAAAVDRELLLACRAEASARRVTGVVAREFLRRRAYRRLGFVRLGDYARERLGVSARALEGAAWVAARLDGLPLIRASFGRGDLSWTQVRALCGVARPEDEAEWLGRARGRTVDELEAMIDAACGKSGTSAPDADGDLIDGEPAVRLRIACPARLRCLWRYALELASRAAGEQLATWRAAEVVAAEGIAGRPAGSSTGDRVLLALVRLSRRLRRSTTQGAAGSSAGGGAATVAVAPAVEVPPSRYSAAAGAAASVAVADAGDAVWLDAWAAPEAACSDAPWVAPDEFPSNVSGSVAVDSQLASCDAFALDARLCAAIRAVRRAEPRIGRLLRILVDQRLYRGLGFSSTDGYVRCRLGISLRKAWALIKVAKTARRVATFAEAYEGGTLSWVRALTLVPVIERETAADWIARANAVTVRRLTDEVNWVLDARDVDGRGGALRPPPLGSVLVPPARGHGAAHGDSAAHGDGAAHGDVAWHRDAQGHQMSPAEPVQLGAVPRARGAWTRNGTPAFAARGDDVPDAEIQFSGPASVVALFRDALDAFVRAGEPRWTALERLLSRVIADWEAEPSHRDPVFARDGWRCAVPACSARRNLHDHHIRFRSCGGGNDLENRVTVCAAHHLHGIHTGVVRAWGTAPAAVHWQLGVRSGATPFLECVGDRLVRQAPG